MTDVPPALVTYVDDEGRIIEWPGKKKRDIQILILQYLASKLEVEHIYSERELNAVLRQWHTFEDWALLRREMFELGLLNRKKDGSAYWRTPNTKLY